MQKTPSKKLFFSKKFLEILFKKDVLVIFILLVLTGRSFLSFRQTYASGLQKSKAVIREPGYEFSDFKPYLSSFNKIGFLTDKDMSSERNDGSFLAAQYILAPLILDLNNPDYEFLILDCTGMMPAFAIMHEIAADPLYVNRHNKILVRKKER